jgi:hypothetical protein
VVLSTAFRNESRRIRKQVCLEFKIEDVCEHVILISPELAGPLVMSRDFLNVNELTLDYARGGLNFERNGNSQGQEGRSTAPEGHGLGVSTRDSSKCQYSQLISRPVQRNKSTASRTDVQAVAEESCSHHIATGVPKLVRGVGRRKDSSYLSERCEGLRQATPCIRADGTCYCEKREVNGFCSQSVGRCIVSDMRGYEEGSNGGRDEERSQLNTSRMQNELTLPKLVLIVLTMFRIRSKIIKTYHLLRKRV